MSSDTPAPSTTPEPPVKIDPDRQRKARRYARVRRRLMLVDLLLGGAYLVVWIAAGWHVALRGWVDGVTPVPALRVLLYAAVFAAPYTLLDLPLSYVSGFALPHRFRQSNQSFGGWVGDQLKGLGISIVLGAPLLELVYWLLRAAPEVWWIVAGGVMLLFTVVLSALAPVVIAPLFYKFTPLDDADLAARLTRLAEQAGYEVKGVYRFDMSTRTKSANAAVMGLGATRRIVLGDTLLESFTPDEIETILAHELAHLVHNDMALGIAINSALVVASFFAAHLALGWAVGAFGLEGLADPAGMPVFALVMGVVGLVAMPLGNAYSRWRERLADGYALHTTGKPAAFADAMIRLANQNLGELNPERWVVVLLYSHPPLNERIGRAQALIAPGLTPG
jgi:STE24 endopeptidase